MTDNGNTEKGEQTQRVVLLAVDVVVDEATLTAWTPIREGDKPRVYNGSPAQCIAVASKNETVPGSYKAVSLRSWKGTRHIEVPDQPTPVATWVDE